MKHNSIVSVVFTAAVLLSAAGSISAQETTGYDIMKKADEVDSGKTSSYTASMTLISKTGSTRIREVICYKKDFGSVNKTVIVFRTPKDVAGVGYITWEYDEKADGTKPDTDSWLYMPAMKKVRRISGSESSGSFMGTDFTYDDMGDRGLSKDTFTLLGGETADGADCWKIECRAKDTAEKNPRRIVWIRKDNYMMQKADFYDRQDSIQRELTASDIKLIDGIWTTGKMKMMNVQTNHSTVIEMKDVHYNQQTDDSLFTVASLERGSIR